MILSAWPGTHFTENIPNHSRAIASNVFYGWEEARLPGWFLERFPAEYHRKRLFDELPAKLMGLLRSKMLRAA